jgi:hypothetical protein
MNQLDWMITQALKDAASLDDCARVLEHLLSGGYSIWTDDSIYRRVSGVYASTSTPTKPHPRTSMSRRLTSMRSS